MSYLRFGHGRPVTSIEPRDQGKKTLVITAVVVTVLLVVVVVLAVVVVGGRDTDTPTTGADVTETDYQQAFDRVTGLTTVSDDYNASFSALGKAYETSSDGPATRQAETSYAQVRAAYEDIITGIGELKAVEDPEVGDAYKAFRKKGLASIAYGDDFVGVKRALTACTPALALDGEGFGPALPARHQEAADACRAALEPLAGSPFPVVAAFGSAFGTLMNQRQQIYDQAGAGELGADQAAQGVQAAYDATFKPAFDLLLSDDGLTGIRDDVSVTVSYQALYDVLETLSSS